MRPHLRGRLRVIMTAAILALIVAILGGCTSATTSTPSASGFSLGAGDPLGTATVRYEGYFERQRSDLTY